MHLSADTLKAGIDPERYYQSQGVEFKVKANSKGWALALCPLHGDKTPSLSVNLNHGGFHCFGCNEKGDLISFHAKLNRMTFKEAKTDLARRFL